MFAKWIRGQKTCQAHGTGALTEVQNSMMWLRSYKKAGIFGARPYYFNIVKTHTHITTPGFFLA